uniref:S100/CaBP-9k-type calcium binding subdomain domain-containing protein n=1 Tax=Callorhinchus milii TaxID=7868 RepID=A0A4W3H859_CALMI
MASSCSYGRTGSNGLFFNLASGNLTMSHEPTVVESSIVKLMIIFKEAAGAEVRDGKTRYSLDVKELKALLQSQIPNFLKGASAAQIESIFSKVNYNKNDGVDFCEYMAMLTKLALESDTTLEA